MSVRIYNVGLKDVKLSKGIPPFLYDIHEFNGSPLVYQFEKIQASYNDPINTTTYAEISSLANENYTHRLSNTGDPYGGFYDITNASEIELSYEWKRFDYASNYQTTLSLENVFNMDWLRSGSFGTKPGNLDINTLAGADLNYLILSNVTLYTWSSYRFIINSEGLKFYINDTLYRDLPSYTLDEVKSRGVDTTSLTVYTSSNKVNIRNLDLVIK